MMTMLCDADGPEPMTRCRFACTIDAPACDAPPPGAEDEPFAHQITPLWIRCCLDVPVDDVSWGRMRFLPSFGRACRV
eukprot:35520-Eustigmatos_ZCMA.PRE.1